jgi:hypothetical protein
MKKYHYISEVIRNKEKHIRSLAALSFEENIEMVFKLQERRKFIKSGRVVSDSRKPKTKST